MAIIIDPDNLLRSQVIFGTESQKISLRANGPSVSGTDLTYNTQSDGSTAGGNLVFNNDSLGIDFTSNSLVSDGDILTIYTGPDAGHYIIATSGVAAHALTVEPDGDFTAFSASTTSNIIYEIRTPNFQASNSLFDGVAKQALYSFAKEEWKTDSLTFDHVSNVTINAGGSGYTAGEVLQLDITEAGMSVTSQGTTQTFVPGDVEFTTNDEITTSDDHHLKADDVVQFSSDGTLPAGLSASTNYWVIAAGLTATVFRVSATIGGSVVNLTDGGTGTHTVEKRSILKVKADQTGALTSVTIVNGGIFSSRPTTLTARPLIEAGAGSGATVDLTFSDDNLIRHEFPFEAITREQMELGGGSSHDNWDYLNNRSRELVRTGGWASKDNPATDTSVTEYTGIITLGNLDVDTQVYYQQTGVKSTSIDFVLTGPVNQSIKVLEQRNNPAPTSYDFSSGESPNRIIRSDGTWFKIRDFLAADVNSGTTDQITEASNPFINGDRVRFVTTGTLPPELNTTSDFFIVNSNAGDYQVSTTLGGSPINFSGDGTGTHTCYLKSWINTEKIIVTEAEDANNNQTYSISGVINETTLETATDIGTDNTLDTTAVATVFNDLRSFLKLFARKKARSYAGAQLSDIGVTSIETIVNRFPLAHAIDPAITTDDAELNHGNTPWSDTEQISTTQTSQTGSNPSAGIGQLTATTDFTITTPAAAIGDTLHITSSDTVPADIGYYTITAVAVGNIQFNTTEHGAIGTASDYSYEILTRVIRDNEEVSGDGATSDQSGGVLRLTSATSDFLATTPLRAVISGSTDQSDNDYLEIISGAQKGIYKLNSTAVTTTTVDVDATDLTSISVESNLEFRILDNGMYLQYKNETINVFTAPASVTSLSFTDANPDTIAVAGTTWHSDLVPGTVLTLTGAVVSANSKSYTVASGAGTATLTLNSSDSVTTSATDTNFAGGVGASAKRGFIRTLGSDVVGFNWRLFGNKGTASQCFEFIQHQLRQTTNIDLGLNTTDIGNGNVVDLLMSFTAPNGTGLNMIIDDIAVADTNNVTYNDITGINRSFPFVATGTINFNINLQNDTSAEYTMFFTNANNNLFGTNKAIIVDNNSGVDIAGNVSAQSSIAFDFDYDNNIQGGRTGATNAAVTLVAIGLTTGQYVITTGTITRSTTNSFTMVAALERNYLNN